MSIIKKYLSDKSIKAEDKQWIKNTKIAYTRVFLKNLPEIPQDEGIDFLYLLFRHVPEEVAEITSEDSELAKTYDDFCRYFIDDLSELIERKIRKRK